MNNITKETILVTGGTGFVGRNLIKSLVDKGADVHVIVDNNSNRTTPDYFAHGVTVHMHDRTLDSMKRILRTSRYRIVFHLAALFIPEHKEDDLDNLIRSNLTFGIHLLEAMKLTDTRLIVNTGTAWQFHDSILYNPTNLYAATKQAFIDICKYYVEAESFSATHLILYDNYGLDDDRPKLLNLLRKISLDNTRLSMSPGEQLLNLVHVSDTVDAFSRAGELMLNSQIGGERWFCVGADQLISLRDLVSLCSQLAASPIDIGWGERPYRGREVMRPSVPFSRVPGWHPRVPLEVGLRALFKPA